MSGSAKYSTKLRRCKTQGLPPSGACSNSGSCRFAFGHRDKDGLINAPWFLRSSCEIGVYREYRNPSQRSVTPNARAIGLITDGAILPHDALNDFPHFASIKPDPPAFWAVIYLHSMSLDHRYVHVADWTHHHSVLFHGGKYVFKHGLLRGLIR
jgi:hypothetical protein